MSVEAAITLITDNIDWLIDWKEIIILGLYNLSLETFFPQEAHDYPDKQTCKL